MVYTATSPEYVNSLILIDGIGPSTVEPKDCVNNLKESCEQSLIPKNKRKLDSLDLAIKARMSNSKISKSAAKLLVANQIRPLDDGWVWTFDDKLKNRSPLKISDSQYKAFIQNLKRPGLLIKSSEFIKQKDLKKHLKLFYKLQVKNFPGNHHIHMDSPAEISEAIELFIKNLDKDA